jgi:hypothetical protein
VELLPHSQQASDVIEIAGEAASHSIGCLLKSRCASRGKSRDFGGKGQGLCMSLTGASPVTTFLAVLRLCMSLTGASPVTTFLAVLRLKCSDTPCGYQEQYRSFRERSQTLW